MTDIHYDSIGIHCSSDKKVVAAAWPATTPKDYLL